MGDTTVNDILIDEEDDNTTKSDVNTFQDSLKEMGGLLFSKYPKKTSNLSHENINGIIRAEVINEYMDVNFGYRYKVLDKLIEQKQIMVVSHNGLGMDKIIEFLKSISATFEQTQLPATLNRLYNK